MAHSTNRQVYRGRLAPTPSGFLHVGHGRTFWYAAQRAMVIGGELILRIEDLDRARCKPEFTAAAIEDLHWLGINWQAGPGRVADQISYVQSERGAWYLDVWRKLVATGTIYASPHSRKDVLEALSAPHEDQENEPLFPVELRPATNASLEITDPGEMNWRFRVPDGRQISFLDARQGIVTRTAGVDFGDFLVWRRDGLPSYELAVVADEYAMQISEVVRGEDLLTSTARQILLYEALGWPPPAWCHVELVRDDSGQRLAKRTAGLSLRELRAAGMKPDELIEKWTGELGNN